MSNPEKIKILAIVEACPCAKAQGARIRAKGVLDLLAPMGNLTVILASRWAHDDESIERMRARYTVTGVYPIEPEPLSLPERLSHEINPNHVNTHNARISEENRREIVGQIEQADIVWLHTIVPVNALGIISLEKAILDVDDLYSQIHWTATKQRKGLALLKSMRLNRIWRRREAAYVKRFGTIVVCSDDDKGHLGNHPNVHVLPNGFDEETCLSPANLGTEPTIGFVGNLTYKPNREGLKWFLEKVWPGIKANSPHCRLRIAGPGGEAHDWNAYPDVTYLGWIEDLTKEMGSWALTVVPIWEGGGTRVKIATAFSLKCPVVATSLGAFGYRLSHRNEILLADSDREFVNCCTELLENPSFARAMAERAHVLFRAKFTWLSMADQMRNIISHALRAKNKNARRSK